MPLRHTRASIWAHRRHARDAKQHKRALPARFRRERLLVIGCGDVGLRLLRKQPTRAWRVLTSTPSRMVPLREAGAVPLLGDLDDFHSLRRLAGLATRVVHLAPPQREGVQDLRSRALVRALRLGRKAPRALTYVSTTGVYGDAAGAWVAETRPVAPHNQRARRRVDAEQVLRGLARGGTAVSVLRAPGIYALDRSGGSPAERLRRGEPVLAAEDDVYTNRIHADDLARACWLALWRARPQRVFNVCDDAVLKMGDYFDLAADLLALPRPPRIPRARAEQVFSPMRMSFLNESRRLDNRRIKAELRLRWRYPTPLEGLRRQ